MSGRSTTEDTTSRHGQEGTRDRGRLGAGMRADLVLVEPGEPWPVVRSVLRAETP
jgi:alpha-D-ribose 1-methylphosphonate 5-triphosphate diphosphatase PhnM